eukprot:CAMPEP_0194133196 /NCGR_PEP_ID=MMETSP0152-20130528/3468_1 /TAXON_ID=1049557 /ORGANISM="Thalassiothrix antarctica, Strain L6-D1" /LENGTH=172 /DNA_ID=CAMNT_0038828463 /DNA_START=23 /DNA_END=541 /DNA_ORIENTATION=+
MTGKVKIPAHVFGYSLALIPACFYGYHYRQNKLPEENFEEKLREKYSHNIDGSSSKRREMLKFLDAVKKGETDKRIDEVLRAGKGKMKRQHRVDERYYGTEEGLRAKEEVIEEIKQGRNNQKITTIKYENKEKNKKFHETEEISSLFLKRSMITLGALGVVTLATLFLGDRR